MKLYSGESYWDKRESAYESHPKLEENKKTEVLIIGSGMSGNLAAYQLAKRGHEVMIIDKDKVASGSSKANTGMLQYSSDKMLTELMESIGEKEAILFYKMCLEAMVELTELNKELGENDSYILRDSIYFASEKEDREKLKKEYEALKKNNFPVEFLNHEDLNKEYGIDKAAALKTSLDAEVNPYKMIQALVQKNKSLGVIYYEDTELDLNNIKDHSLKSIDGKEIYFDHLILATGYGKVYDCIKDKANIERTYAFSAKTNSKNPWPDKVMIWETRRPYLYFRTAKDNHIIAGGEDEKISEVVEDEKIIFEKTEKIKREIEDIYPNLDMDIKYRWNALFGTSKDGLPFIGPDLLKKNHYYLLGYEGNGTCYSMAGANILADLIENKENKYADIVKVDR